jgi:hypothetical protein
MTLTMRGFGRGGLVLLAALVLTSMTASASPITGTFGFDGPGVLTFYDGADFIDFCATVTGSTCNNNGTGTGNFNVTGPGTQSFSVLTGPVPGPATLGTIDDLTDHTPPAAGYTYLPVGVPVSINNIIALAGFPTWDFQANILPVASCVSTSTQQCLGAFQLDQNGPNVSVEMNILGTLINTAGGDSSFDIALTGNFVDTTIAAVEGGAVTPTGVFSNNWSASVTAAAIPEPGTSTTMLLAGCGLIFLARIRRTKKR